MTLTPKKQLTRKKRILFTHCKLMDFNRQHGKGYKLMLIFEKGQET